MAGRAKILVVEDSRPQLEWLVEVLARDGHDVRTASGGREAIRLAAEERPDLVLLDVILPDMHGLEVLRFLKRWERTADEPFLPVILLSVKSDVEARVTGLRVGADDFIAKPFAEAEILARCASMLRIKSLQDQLRCAQAKLGELSVTDELTGLKNRRFLDARLGEEFARALRYSDPLALVMIDLDHFKRVNDGFGHPAGDLVLREAAARIRGAIRDPDVAARFGGEEFAVLLPKAHLAGAVAAAQRIWTALGTRTYATLAEDGGEPRVKVTASVGLACFPSKDVTSPDLLVAHADQALYDAKRCGRNAICLHQGRPYRYVVGG